MNLLRKFESLPYFQRESVKDMAVVVVAGACVVAGLILRGVL